MTDFLFSPVPLLDRGTLPGAAANRTFDVIAATTTVLIRLRVNSSDCNINTGRRKPGSEADGSGKSAHHTSPLFTTSPLSQDYWIAIFVDSHPGGSPPDRKSCPALS